MKRTQKQNFSEILQSRVQEKGLSEITRDTFTAEEKKLIRELVIPEGVKNIGAYAFAGCSNLRNITLPDSLKEIEDRVFEGCRKLRNIVLPDNLTYTGQEAFIGGNRKLSITFRGETYDDPWDMCEYDGFWAESED